MLLPEHVFHVNAIATCPHQALVSVVGGSVRVLVNSQPVATVADQHLVTACPFQIPPPVGPKPQPCVRVQWTTSATRVLVEGKPPVLRASTGVCFSVEQLAQGPVLIKGVQGRVSAL